MYKNVIYRRLLFSASLREHKAFLSIISMALCAGVKYPLWRTTHTIKRHFVGFTDKYKFIFHHKFLDVKIFKYSDGALELFVPFVPTLPNGNRVFKPTRELYSTFDAK